MTGFGVGRAPLGNGRIVVEVRSVNHRFLDVRVRAPRDLADLAMHLEQRARQRLRRGRYEVVVRAEGVITPPSAIDVQRAKSIYESLCFLRDRVAPGSDVPFSMLSAVPDIFVAENQDQHEAAQEAVGQALDQAFEASEGMRSQEGAALRKDLMARLAMLRKHTAIIGARRLEIVDCYRKRLQNRVHRLLSGLDLEVDPSRLEQEVVIAAERCDVEEEITRLDSHFGQFEKFGEIQDPVGRRLDFLLQEMAREINTIGSKSQDALVAHAVVEIKAEIERMREQVQNVE